MDELLNKKCKPCEGGTPPLSVEAATGYLSQVGAEWILEGNIEIKRNFKFKNFRGAIDFVNSITDIAENENHHPDIIINYNRVTLKLTTHAIKGLSENDFIVARKIDNLIAKSV